MKTLLFAGLILMSAAAAQATRVGLLSPETAETFAIANVDDKHLFWNAKESKLCAVVRFSNRPASKDRSEESFVFTFPGVKFDEKTKTFYALSPDGEPVTVAAQRKGLFGDSVVPSPGTLIFIINNHGKVNLLLKSMTNVPADDSVTLHWIERSDSWTLQKLIRDLAGTN